MSDDAQSPPADAHTPEAPGNDAGARPVSPGTAAEDAASRVDLGKPGPADRLAGPPASDAASEPAGPGSTLASGGPAPWSAPSVHDQQTVTAMPAMGGTEPSAPAPVPTAPSRPWTSPAPQADAMPAAGPFAPPAGPSPASGPANPFAAPGPTASAGAPENPFAAPGADASAAGPAGPFAPPAAAAPHARDQAAVPPPPIAPDGPGQVPYGYPGGYGHPGQAGYGGPQGYYGWPGMGPMPSNGPGTAGLVLGILAAVVFCLWPLAIILGILGVVFGAVGRGKARRGEATNPGQALAGIICGAAGIVLGVGFGVLVIVTG
ncbi:DUF4190 domain-containing protein [Streptomyces griseicoloratus]|nr:DUF4190 domain-containing protein [Streptomyces griseicoloratus]